MKHYNAWIAEAALNRQIIQNIKQYFSYVWENKVTLSHLAKHNTIFLNGLLSLKCYWKRNNYKQAEQAC